MCPTVIINMSLWPSPTPLTTPPHPSILPLHHLYPTPTPPLSYPHTPPSNYPQLPPHPSIPPPTHSYLSNYLHRQDWREPEECSTARPHVHGPRAIGSSRQGHKTKDSRVYQKELWAHVSLGGRRVCMYICIGCQKGFVSPIFRMNYNYTQLNISHYVHTNQLHFLM